MARNLLVLPVLIALFCGCSGKNNQTLPEAKPPIEDALILEFTFGADVLLGDFMLASPNGIAVSTNDDIMVVDEDWVKVFDNTGKPLVRFGGLGDGPGEFQRAIDIRYSSNGYFTIYGRNTAHYFRPDYSYITRRNFRSERPFLSVVNEKNLMPMRPEIVLNIGENERLYSLDTQGIDADTRAYHEIFLFYETADSLTVLANYPQSNIVSHQTTTVYYGTLGQLLVVPLSDRRIAFTHSHHDSDIDANPPTYSITILNLDSLERSIIRHPYTPQEIDWKPRVIREELRQRSPAQAERLEELNRITEAFMLERQYQASLNEIMVDGDYLFAFTLKPRREYEPELTDEVPEYLVDVFNINSREYISSTFLPVPWILTIHKGYLYKCNNYIPGDVDPLIEKYRIDQRVYSGG